MGKRSGYWDADRLAPCGTQSAARRHWRRHEPLDEACRQAARNEFAGRRGLQAGTQSIDRREVRNNLPEFRPYVYRGTGVDTLTSWMDVAS